ncbi:probable ascorbate-specific transmembrane electron transporter 1 isoform X1 [Primulina huaijiensis]|uniref:probable ascorbate-specific transmembrane electron transporter 1 isoform X1 n=1 Tax=Primulina huaijiensis TaxID=1492673 RepID=UPI003CC77D5E
MAFKRSSNYDTSALPVTLFAHVVAIAVITLLLVWLLHFREGVAFKSEVEAKIFNMHPLLMVIGFVLLSGEAIMAYKTLPAIRKWPKMIHSLLHFVALGTGIVGIYAVFKFQRDEGIPHMYSFHSWLGMSTICLFALQWMFSFFAFVYPRAEASTRKSVAPWHAVLGIIIFFMAIISTETGLVEKFFILRLQRNQEAVVINFTALLVFMYAASVVISVLFF